VAYGIRAKEVPAAHVAAPGPAPAPQGADGLPF